MLGRDNIKSVEDLIKEFLMTLPSDTEFAYGDLKAYMSRRGGDVYPDASIKTTINRLGYVVKIKGEDIYVLNEDTRWSIDELIKAIADTLAAVDERKMRKMDLLNAVMKNTGRQISLQKMIHISGSLLTRPWPRRVWLLTGSINPATNLRVFLLIMIR
jgi:hypothetical protein